jgi:nucleoside-diphosphate-sugar epimerase
LTFSPFSPCRHRLPHFSVSYSPDFRDSIAKTWPASIDDSAARSQWGWAPQYDLQALADDMLQRLAAKYKVQLPPALAEQQGSSSSSSGEAAAAV